MYTLIKNEPLIIEYLLNRKMAKYYSFKCTAVRSDVHNETLFGAIHITVTRMELNFSVLSTVIPSDSVLCVLCGEPQQFRISETYVSVINWIVWRATQIFSHNSFKCVLNVRPLGNIIRCL